MMYFGFVLIYEDYAGRVNKRWQVILYNEFVEAVFLALLYSSQRLWVAWHGNYNYTCHLGCRVRQTAGIHETLRHSGSRTQLIPSDPARSVPSLINFAADINTRTYVKKLAVGGPSPLKRNCEGVHRRIRPRRYKC